MNNHNDDEPCDDLLDVKPEDDLWGIVKTYKTRRLAQKIIWMLSERLTELTRMKIELLKSPDQIYLLSKAIKWLSGIVVDDWSHHQFNEIYEELSRSSIGYLIPRDRILWNNFCEEVARHVEKKPEYGTDNITDNVSYIIPNFTLDEYITIGVQANYLERRGFFKDWCLKK